MKYYNIEVISYNEEETKKILEKIKDYKYAYATHDKDIIESTGELKKEHTHIQIYGETQRSIKAWSKELDIKENMIEIIKYKPKAIQYLIHKNNPEKYQYERNIIKSNFDISDYFKEKSDETREIKMILEYIDKKGIVKYKDILYYAIDNNIWSTYRRNYNIIKDYIFEKNELTKENIIDKIKISKT